MNSPDKILVRILFTFFVFCLSRRL